MMVRQIGKDFVSSFLSLSNDTTATYRGKPEANVHVLLNKHNFVYSVYFFILSQYSN